MAWFFRFLKHQEETSLEIGVYILDATAFLRMFELIGLQGLEDLADGYPLACAIRRA